MGRPRPNLVFVPSDDAALASLVAEVAVEPDIAAALDRLDHHELQRRIRERFANATVRPREELARAYPDEPPVWYVARGRERFRLRASVWIGAPREDVFRVYVDPSTIDQWQGVARVRAHDRSRTIVGTSWEAEYEILRIRLAGTFRIVQAAVPLRIRVEATGPLHARLWYVTRFEEKDGGTRVDVEGDYELPFELLSRVPSRLFAEREIERVVAASHERLKALCESTFGDVGSAQEISALEADGDGSEPRDGTLADTLPPGALPSEVAG
jgi:uncharacterized protein YndB with AHSA1/START domain